MEYHTQTTHLQQFINRMSMPQKASNDHALKKKKEIRWIICEKYSCKASYEHKMSMCMQTCKTELVKNYK